jgi:hypothetical protein
MQAKRLEAVSKLKARFRHLTKNSLGSSSQSLSSQMAKSKNAPDFANYKRLPKNDLPGTWFAPARGTRVSGAYRNSRSESLITNHQQT